MRDPDGMCGRMVLDVGYDDLGRILEEVQDICIPPHHAFAWSPRFNLAPTQEAPVLLREGDEHALRLHRWGLVPRSAADDPDGFVQRYQTFNAHAEAVTASRLWGPLFQAQRCVVPLTGWYEWLERNGAKQPTYFCARDRRQLFCAGLWEEAPTASGALRTHAIVTCESGPFLRRIHGREPVTLGPAGVRRWLDPESSLDEVLGLLAAAPAGRLDAYRVGPVVGDGPELIRPVSMRRTLFD
ncbi:MAG: SOS response-associated peptidase [Myxococcaceae bacterium]|nr:MAG: SOS response-associated peptidase [Myxococcaceae bacterium]